MAFERMFVEGWDKSDAKKEWKKIQGRLHGLFQVSYDFNQYDQIANDRYNDFYVALAPQTTPVAPIVTDPGLNTAIVAAPATPGPAMAVSNTSDSSLVG